MRICLKSGMGWTDPQGVQRLTRGQVALLAAGMLAITTYLLVPYSATSELVIYNGMVATTAVVALLGARRLPRSVRAPWMLVALSLAGFLVGELLWWWFGHLGIDPFPSIADGFFLGAYVPLAGAAVLLNARWRRQRDASSWLDACLLTVVMGLAVWVIVMEPSATDPSVGALDKVFTLAYPLADLLVLGLVIQLTLTRGIRSRAVRLLAGGLVVMALADVLWGWLELSESFESSPYLDSAWLVAYLLMAAASLDRSAGAAADGELVAQGRGRLMAILAAVIVPPAFLMAELGNLGVLGNTSATVITVVSMLSVILVAVRLWALLGQTRQLEQRRGSERLAALVDHSSDAIVLLDADGAITFASPAVAGLWGYDPASALGTPLPMWVPDDERSRLARRLEQLAQSPAGTIAEVHGSLVASGGNVRAFEATARNLLADPSVEAMVVTMRDVTARRELEAQLERQAFHDHLTGLANRSLFTDRVAHALDRLARKPENISAVLFIDLDDFKSVNDGMGHGAGDQLLGRVADRIRVSLRPSDTVARFGGDEFAVLVEDLPTADFAKDLARRLLEMLRLPMSVGELSLGVSASVGVAYLSPSSTVETILADADMAMYNAKSQGKGRVEVFNDALRDSAERQLTLKVELPRALKASEFRLVYQPIHDVATGAMSGFEALVRWDHPLRGEVAPMEFIPAAEESGLILELGRWVLGEAAHQAVEWNAASPCELSMSVNVSAVQLQHPDFLDDVAAALSSSGLPPHLLTLELTESVLIETGRVVAVLENLRTLGVKIAIDDFGTGYSSLSYLQHFPVSAVKIDRAFVSQLTATGDEGLVRSILAIAEALNLSTVAEGVETQGQLETLQHLECTFVQGFYLGRPQTPEQIERQVGQLGSGDPVGVGG
ncbi:MAG: EAL domain-containing protein [Microthrixaceae bacterium]